jgi:DNA adenine methylase
LAEFAKEDNILRQETEVCRPFVKWAGGKSQLIQKMTPYFPKKFSRYFEPFLGGGAVFFYVISKRPDLQACLSDITHDLINAYEVIRDDVNALEVRLTRYQTEFGKLKTKPEQNEYYLKVRSNPPNVDKEPIQRASWFIFLNKTSYNGLYRVNSKGEFNVPYGDYPKAILFEKENLERISRLLNRKTVTILRKDYSTVLLENAREGDFCYLDPPYYSDNNKGFTSYNSSLFTKEDQKKLAEVFATLTDRGVRILLSNSESVFVRSLFKEEEKKSKDNTRKYDYSSVEALRVINCKGSKRTGAKELLIKNY